MNKLEPTNSFLTGSSVIVTVIITLRRLGLMTP